MWEAGGPGGPVALKFVPALPGEAAGALDPLRSAPHPGLLAVHDAFRSGPWLVVAGELADESLADRLEAARGRGEAGLAADQLRVLGGWPPPRCTPSWGGGAPTAT